MTSNSEAVEQQLARANLLRMRQQFGQAEQQCLTILNQFPENVEAHELIGDVFADQGKHEQAIHWFELALELKADSPAIRQKLAAEEQRQLAQTSQATASQLGLPSKRNGNGLVIGAGAVLLILIVAMVTFALRPSGGAPKKPPVVSDSVQATEEAHPNTGASQTTPEAPTTQPTADQPHSAGLKEDADLMAKMGTGDMGSKLLAAWQDPRSKELFLTIRLEAGESERVVAATAAKEAASLIVDAPLVSVRSVREGKVVYMSDVPRQRLDETAATDWAQAHPNEVWSDYVVTNEWHANAETVPTNGQ